jgi:hypothetical protein
LRVFDSCIQPHLSSDVSQPSDSYAFDGGGVGDDNLDLLFAPAAPAVVKKTKGNKVVLGKDKHAATTVNGSSSSSSNITTPKSSRHGRKTYEMDQQQQHQQQPQAEQTAGPSSPSPTKSTPTKSPPPSDPGTPPLKPRKRYAIQEEEEDVWYKEWWMSCFPDAFKNLVPRR